MKIFIPTKGRSHIIRTTKYLGNSPYDVNLMVCESEVEDYKSNENNNQFNIIPVPDKWRIADIREWVVYKSGERFVCMMDDDLIFFKRDDIQDSYLYAIADISEMLFSIENILKEYAHCSVSSRVQNAQSTKSLRINKSFYVETCRPYRIYGYDTDIIKGEELSFNLPGVQNTMDDFHMTLNLMELGYVNLVNCEYAHGQRGSDSAGGASSYRTLETLKNCAIALKKAHPEFVTLVEKKTITSWGATKANPVTRTDVRIQWKKSLGSKIKDSKL